MGDYVRRINQADTLARMWREGTVASVKLIDSLLDLGFYNVYILLGVSPKEDRVVAAFDGVEYRL